FESDRGSARRRDRSDVPAKPWLGVHVHAARGTRRSGAAVSSAKILIVDDAQQVRRVLRTALSAAGYTVFEAGTGEEALESIRQSTPDAILLDVNMPGIGGLEAYRE